MHMNFSYILNSLYTYAVAMCIVNRVAINTLNIESMKRNYRLSCEYKIIRIMGRNLKKLGKVNFSVYVWL